MTCEILYNAGRYSGEKCLRDVGVTEIVKAVGLGKLDSALLDAPPRSVYGFRCAWHAVCTRIEAVVLPDH